MRKTKRKYAFGAMRVVERFAFLPVRAENDDIIEWRWLERVKIQQVYINKGYYGAWKNSYFIDKGDDYYDTTKVH